MATASHSCPRARRAARPAPFSRVYRQVNSLLLSIVSRPEGQRNSGICRTCRPKPLDSRIAPNFRAVAEHPCHFGNRRIINMTISPCGRHCPRQTGTQRDGTEARNSEDLLTLKRSGALDGARRVIEIGSQQLDDSFLCIDRLAAIKPARFSVERKSIWDRRAAPTSPGRRRRRGHSGGQSACNMRP